MLQLGQAKGPSAAASTGLGGQALRLGEARDRAPRLGQARGPGSVAT